MVPLELPATSIVQANLANQPTLLLSQDHHAVFVLLMTSPGEPSIPRSVRVKEPDSHSHHSYSAFTSEEMPLTNRRLLMDCHHEIVHISHSQTLNPTSDRGHYPRARLSGQLSPFKLVHVGLHTFPPSSRSVDQTVHRFSAISHTDDVPVPVLVPVLRSVRSAVPDLQLILGKRPFFASPVKTFILKDPATVRNSCRPLLETVGDTVGLAPNCGSVNPCITKRAFSESSDFPRNDPAHPHQTLASQSRSRSCFHRCVLEETANFFLLPFD